MNLHSLLQTRASKLSFNDVVKRLASTKEDDPTFISKKVSSLSSGCRGSSVAGPCHQSSSKKCYFEAPNQCKKTVL